MRDENREARNHRAAALRGVGAGPEAAVMKILLVNKAYTPHLGGAETVVRQIAVGMSRRGHHVKALCFGGEDAAEKVDGVEVRRIRPVGHVGSAPVGLRFVEEFFELSKWADVLNLHSPNPMGEMALLLSRSLRGKKIVCTYHGDPQRPKFLLPAYDVMLRRFFRRCDAIAVSSPPLSENSRVLRALSSKGKTRVIPLGVRTKDYENPLGNDMEDARRLLAPLPEGSFKVMYAGRMVYYKGLEVLLSAMAKIKSLGWSLAKDRPVCAFLVGSGPAELGVKAFIAENRLGGVLVTAHQPDKVYRALFKLADCFVLPSTHPTEAYGIVLAEAMASGLPVISTELGTGTSWVNLDGETGIVVPPGDAGALAEAIVYLARHEEARKAFAAGSLARAHGFLREDAMLNAYEGLFLSKIPAGEAVVGEAHTPHA
jgi:rhamnosyl/mannosyltransferase